MKEGLISMCSEEGSSFLLQGADRSMAGRQLVWHGEEAEWDAGEKVGEVSGPGKDENRLAFRSHLGPLKASEPVGARVRPALGNRWVCCRDGWAGARGCPQEDWLGVGESVNSAALFPWILCTWAVVLKSP